VETKPDWGPVLVLAIASMGAGCVDDDEPFVEGAATCGAADAYAPYAPGHHPSGDVAKLPWRGATSAYPNGVETFDDYKAGAPIECSSGKALRSHLDVTAGCLIAAVTGDADQYHRALVELTEEGRAFRAVALGHDDDDLVKWIDQRSEYRFYYSGSSGGVNPGFKVFARYRTEDDLYVASWRLDGVAQIQKKQCGEYTILARSAGVPVPSPRAWHRIRFDAVGDKLSLYLDGQIAIVATSPTFSWGTVGIRIDGMTGVYLDDWRVF
jgi:hypothetical protein